MPKVIDSDMWGRETVADKLIKDNLTSEEADALASDLNKHRTERNSNYYALVVPDNHRLCRGMRDLV